MQKVNWQGDDPWAEIGVGEFAAPHRRSSTRDIISVSARNTSEYAAGSLP
jgi:hypothetical protein